jgi:hypothetical protein
VGQITPRTDENEVKQLIDLGRLSGLGEEIYDDEFASTAAEFGLDIPDGSVPNNEPLP